MPLTRRDNDCSPEQVDRNERAASWNERCTFLGPACSSRGKSGWRATVLNRPPAPKLRKRCPLPGTTLGRTTPAAGAHREPPTEGSTMRLVKLVIIIRPTERAAEDDDGRRRLTCPP
jgi:hypothetical protein